MATTKPTLAAVPLRSRRTLPRPPCSWCGTGRRPTTGKVLPGRAPGLHLADDGQAPGRAPPPSASPSSSGSTRSTPRRSSAPARPRRRSPRRAGCKAQVDRGLLECDFGEWTGAELKKLMKLPEWGTVQRAPSTFRFPGGESFTEMQTRMVTTLDQLRARAPRRHDRVRLARRHRSRPPSPTPSAPTSTCSSASSSALLGHRDRLRPRRAGRAHRQLDRRLARRAAAVAEATMGVFYEFDEVDAFTVGAIGEPGAAHVLPPGPRAARRGSP